MTDKQFNSELEYQLLRSIINQMKNEDIITEQDYKKIDTKLLRKYGPIFGTLYRWNGLLPWFIRVNI